MLRAQMLERCPGAEFIDIGTLWNYVLLINERGVATIVPSEDSVVRGVVWGISPRDIETLDQKEGVRRGRYHRVTTKILLKNGQSISAESYIAEHATPGAPREGYLEKLEAGAIEHGLPGDYVSSIQALGRARGR
jgi:gamma-glutamylcyclotransferase (GGCT)/AIG2-like uncharacterized protein YtfP